MGDQKSILVAHGVLLNIRGRGILLTGPSGSGKSELALRLVRKGHQLVADDVVEVCLNDHSLNGSSPDELHGLLHVRGIGVIDIRKMYGSNAVCRSSRIDYIFEMEKMAGIDFDKRDSQGRKCKIKVKPSRSIGLLLETVARTIVTPEIVRELGSIFPPIRQSNPEL